MRRAFAVVAISVVSFAFAVSCKQPTTDTTDRATATATSGATSSAPPVIEAEVGKFLDDFATTMSKNDVVGLDKMLADEFRFVSHDGEIFTKAQLLEVLRSGTEKFESLLLEDRSIRAYGDTAVVTASSTQKATLEGKDHSFTATASIVLVKRRDGWRMVLAQLSERPSARPASATLGAGWHECQRGHPVDVRATRFPPMERPS